MLPLKTHTCSPAELGLGGDSAREKKQRRFFSIRDELIAEVKTYIGLWQCIDEDQDLNLYGYFDSSYTQSLQISLKLCDETKNTCQKLDLQKDLGNKYIGLLYNERTYDQTKPSGERIKEDAKVTWIPV